MSWTSRKDALLALRAAVFVTAFSSSDLACSGAQYGSHPWVNLDLSPITLAFPLPRSSKPVGAPAIRVRPTPFLAQAAQGEPDSYEYRMDEDPLCAIEGGCPANENCDPMDNQCLAQEGFDAASGAFKPCLAKVGTELSTTLGFEASATIEEGGAVDDVKITKSTPEKAGVEGCLSSAMKRVSIHLHTGSTVHMRASVSLRWVPPT